ncbi:MAG: hypothetical protein RLZZ136_285 [Pseudomonadota bacterium]|jgi:hypothetical protein
MTTKNPDTSHDTLAKKRFMAINLVRLSGVALILVGLLFALDRIDVQPAHLIGVMFILFGMIDAFIMPRVLARRWKSLDQ